jgi:hypothetical protein
MPSWLAPYQSGLIFVAVAVAFVALLLSDLSSTNQAECSVCVDFNGRTECATGQGVDQTDARQSAQTVACSRLTNGVSDAFRCSAAAPAQLTCKDI